MNPDDDDDDDDDDALWGLRKGGVCVWAACKHVGRRLPIGPSCMSGAAVSGERQSGSFTGAIVFDRLAEGLARTCSTYLAVPHLPTCGYLGT
jgi:hypothetical protein